MQIVSFDIRRQFAWNGNTLFLKKENIILSSAEFVQGVAKVNYIHIYKQARFLFFKWMIRNNMAKLFYKN